MDGSHQSSNKNHKIFTTTPIKNHNKTFYCVFIFSTTLPPIATSWRRTLAFLLHHRKHLCQKPRHDGCMRGTGWSGFHEHCHCHHHTQAQHTTTMIPMTTTRCGIALVGLGKVQHDFLYRRGHARRRQSTTTMTMMTMTTTTTTTMKTMMATTMAMMIAMVTS